LPSRESCTLTDEKQEKVLHETLEQLRYDNSFIRALPADPESRNNLRQVHGACFSRIAPSPVPDPRLIAASPEVAEILGLSPEASRDPAFVEVLSGNRTVQGMAPFAACYGGHQFGNWAGQLGDGRAITLGEVITPNDERWELQLKGAGRTPYSRSADGRAVMRSSVREFLCSEAMHHLGVPTTRALSLVSTGAEVVRDMFYSGRPAPEPGAIVCRVAPSFIRFGNFELLAARGDAELLRKLTDYTIDRHYPWLREDDQGDLYVRFLDEVCQRTARMIVEWMRVGFVHGVMNTDNMSILGLTIDYGPYGWLDDFDPGWTPNTTDAEMRRYCYGNQPRIAHWNLLQLANALHPLVGSAAPMESVLLNYGRRLAQGQQQMMASKLGLRSFRPDSGEDGNQASPDLTLVNDLLQLLHRVETDMTLFYRALANLDVGGHHRVDSDDGPLLAVLRQAYYSPDALAPDYQRDMAAWLRRYVQRLQEDGEGNHERRAGMNAVNPLYVPRNYLAQLAIDQAEQGDGSRLHDLLDVLRHPYEEQAGREAYAARRPDWARDRPGCSMLSCSS